MHVILRLLLPQIFSADLSRCQLKLADRTPDNIHVGEFQNFVSDNMASMLSEAHKFGLRFALANQTPAQLSHQTELGGTLVSVLLLALGVPFAVIRESAPHRSLNDNRSLPCCALET
jgi:hypothetical protein